MLIDVPQTGLRLVLIALEHVREMRFRAWSTTKN
jgi:hypothetical protein